MYNGKTRKGQTRDLVRIYVQDRKTGEGTDLMQDAWGDREHEER